MENNLNDKKEIQEEVKKEITSTNDIAATSADCGQNTDDNVAEKGSDDKNKSDTEESETKQLLKRIWNSNFRKNMNFLEASILLGSALIICTQVFSYLSMIGYTIRYGMSYKFYLPNLYLVESLTIFILFIITTLIAILCKKFVKTGIKRKAYIWFFNTIGGLFTFCFFTQTPQNIVSLFIVLLIYNLVFYGIECFIYKEFMKPVSVDKKSTRAEIIISLVLCLMSLFIVPPILYSGIKIFQNSSFYTIKMNNVDKVVINTNGEYMIIADYTYDKEKDSIVIESNYTKEKVDGYKMTSHKFSKVKIK